MPVVVGLLRAVNLGPTNKISMETLRAICGSLGLENAATYIQSGNVVFRTKKRDLAKLALELEAAIKAQCGFQSPVVLRTAEDMVGVIARNPFEGREGLKPGWLQVTFLSKDPGEAGRARVRAIDTDPEELHAVGSELYTYYANGVGQSKLQHKAVERAIGCSGTARNWNTVLKLAEMAKGL